MSRGLGDVYKRQLLKITGQAYGMYENGKRGLPIEHLITLCRYYDVSSDYILGLTDCKNPGAHKNTDQ